MNYPQSYWDFLLKLHQVWSVKQKLSEALLILEERKLLKAKTPTFKCLEHCDKGQDESVCGGFLYNRTTGEFDEDKAKEHVGYLKYLSLHKDELREKEKKEIKGEKEN